MTILRIEKVSANAKAPRRATTHAACWDIFADLASRKVRSRPYKHGETRELESFCDGEFILGPGGRALIPTGWKMRPESPDFSIDFLPRSGGPYKTGVSLSNCVGVIDADYSNETYVSLINHGGDYISIKHGQAIAQLRLAHVIPLDLMATPELPSIESSRTGGFGSTDTPTAKAS